ncbi:thiamine pyrophosphokinase [Cystobasidiomycetes sp. EMM_F5]
MSLHKRWDPTSFLCADDCRRLNQRPNALIILNTPITNKQTFTTVWTNGAAESTVHQAYSADEVPYLAALRFCADGGANRLYDAFQGDNNLIPDLIKGDLDSLRQDVRSFYATKGVPVIQDGDQYETDLGKCIKSVREREHDQQVLIFGGLSGRLDQTAHTLHVLFKLLRSREWAWIVSEENLTCLLDIGRHVLVTPQQLLGPTCGILPLGIQTAHVSTTGLEWDLDLTETSFFTSISTSNHVTTDTIEITTDQPIVWTVELRK